MINSWKTLPVGTFKKLMALPDGEDEDRYWKILAILNGTTVDDIMSRPLQEVTAMRKEVAFLDERPPVVASRHEYVLGDTTYVFTDHLQDITVAQFVDWTNTENNWENMSVLLSYVLIPKGHRYNDGYRIDKVQKDIDEYLSMLDARALSGFFLGSFINSLVCQRRSLRKTVKRARKAGVETAELERTLKELDGALRAFGYSGR